MLGLLTRTLLLISNALLIPVILVIFALLIWTLILLGGFIREWYERRSAIPALEEAIAVLRQHNPIEDAWRALVVAPHGLPKRFVTFVDGNYGDAGILEQALSTLDNNIAALLARHSFITRVSPIFGLMGTLIPLGPALSGLANGNMEALSGNLIVAFTATVVGLLISGISFGMGLARRIWYSRDMTSLEFVVDTIESQKGKTICLPAAADRANAFGKR